MKIVIPGGSGLLGRSLSKALLQDGHEVVVLTRSLQPGVVVHE
ncbi:MAG: NAD-dependent epimerase/dehydratase family protein, partial [Acidobacteriota bacterium]|nr:NAD-dependent epimerase/dehydratase family protein [Acidobacteriota bacterium]